MLDKFRDIIGVTLLYWALCSFSQKRKDQLGPSVLLFLDEMREEQDERE